MTLQTPPEVAVAAPRIRGGDVLACGFAMTVGAWLVAYVSRLPAVAAPGQATVVLMLAVIFVGGIFTGRYGRRGMVTALLAGAVSGLLNNLLVGSILHDVTAKTAGTMAATVAAATGPSSIPVPSMALWFGGSILCNMILAGAGGVIGSFFPSPRRGEIRWTQIFAIVLAAATLPLLTIGGLVTAFHSGLAVPDWPQSYGYNMFLFPLSKMQSNQGNFYEHAHRLMGSLVGFTALGLAIYTTIAERRGWLKIFAWAIGIAIAVQAVMGGLRVTEKNLNLAIAHGVFAQIVFASMACFAAMSGRSFETLPRKAGAAVTTDRALTAALVAALIAQLILGAVVRHKDTMVMMHITMAVAVTFLVLACGFRAWGIHGAVRPVRNSGLWLMGLVIMQITLGVLALIFRSGPHATPTMEGAFLTTAHQANGALLLAVAAVLATWTWRMEVRSTAFRLPTASAASVSPRPPAA